MMKKFLALILLLASLPFASMELARTTDVIQVITGSAVTVDVHTDWADNTTTAFTPTSLDTDITTATTTTVVPSPAASTQRTVKSFTIHNKHASSSNPVTVTHYDGSTTATILAYTLLAGETIVYTGAADYYVLDANFAKKITAAIGPGTNNTVAVFNSGTQIRNGKISDDGTTIIDSNKVHSNASLYVEKNDTLNALSQVAQELITGALRVNGATDSLIGNVVIGKPANANPLSENFSLNVNGGLSGDSTSAIVLQGHRASSISEFGGFYGLDSTAVVTGISFRRDVDGYNSSSIGLLTTKAGATDNSGLKLRLAINDSGDIGIGTPSSAISTITNFETRSLTVQTAQLASGEYAGLNLVGDATSGSGNYAAVQFFNKTANRNGYIAVGRDGADNSSIMTIGTANAGSGANAISINHLQVVAIPVALAFTNTLISASAPTISSGFGSSPSISGNNGTAAFEVNVGTGGSASSGVIGLPTASTGWNCYCTDITTSSATVSQCKQTASSTTTATVGNFTDLTVAAAWAASDKLRVSCFAY